MYSLRLLLAAVFLGQTQAQAPIRIDSFTPAPFNGPVTVDFLSTSAPIDAPKLSAYNTSSFDWWYFDTVSKNAGEGLFLTFNLGTPVGTPSTDTTPYVLLVGIGADGSPYFYNANITSNAVVISTPDQASAGFWQGTGLNWVATPNAKHYTVTFNAPQLKGFIQFDSTSPAHYPCGPIQPGSDLVVAPYVGWDNPVPDADVTVALQVGSKSIFYQGIGYHDKNWGSRPFASTFNDWYWGHTRVGDYKVVWFLVQAPRGFQKASIYVAKGGQVLKQSCASDSFTIRPLDTPFPRGTDPNWTSGYNIKIPLGTQGVLDLNVTASHALLESPGAYRWIGTSSGSLDGGPKLTGYGQWEELWNPLAQ